jgi:NAD(P) transhydrogenase
LLSTNNLQISIFFLLLFLNINPRLLFISTILGSGIGAVLASEVGPTELPQTVAAFHSLVGLAAMSGAAGEYLAHAGSLDVGTLLPIYLATFIGGVTATGSMVAFGKLAGMMKVSI